MHNSFQTPVTHALLNKMQKKNDKKIAEIGPSGNSRIFIMFDTLIDFNFASDDEKCHSNLTTFKALQLL